MTKNSSKSGWTAKATVKRLGRTAPTAGCAAVLDAPTLGDHRRLRRARRQARTRFKEIEKERDAAVLEAFRVELGAAVRSASPLVVPFLAELGLTLDEAVALIRPQAGWPNHPRLLGPKGALRAQSHLLRHYAAGLHQTHITRHPLNCCSFNRPDGGYLMIEVIDHSVDLHAKIGNVLISTRFGELRVEFLDQFPQAILSAVSVGRLWISSITMAGGG